MAIGPERWATVERLYHDVLMRSIAERAAFLAEVCAGDEELRREVESLLLQRASADAVFTRGAAVAAAALVSDVGASALTGRRLGAYQLLAPIGAGGMGEVYRARDTRLGRDVAIKMLPRAFSDHPDRLARFEREARVLASLNHPHIATIYGIEDADGVRAIVMELVEGDTLAERIARAGDGLPIKEALDIARQIADALDAAHEKGIVHRDLKPANIKITSQGIVKVLDFGLAKLEAGGAGKAGGAGREVTEAPTITVDDTREGLVVGTAAYMSPEQARGQTVDKRTDIWAFGCVAYEMLTGHPPFPGDTVSDIIAAILEREPEWRALPATTSGTVQRLLRRCLEKDPKRRLHDIADARIEIDDVLVGAAVLPASVPVTPRSPGRNRLAWTVAALVLAALVVSLAVGAATYLRSMPTDTRAYHTSIVPPEGVTFVASIGASGPVSRFALSPDGQRLAFLAAGADRRTRLWVRPLDTFAAQPLAGTEDAHAPFWSPDGRFIAFVAEGKLKKIAVSGGPPLTVADVPGGFDSEGTWNRDDVILFGQRNRIARVFASGGDTPSPVTTLDTERGETGHRYPFFLPDGRHFLYLAVGTAKGGVVDPRAVYVGSLDSKERKQLPEVRSNATYARGRLLYLRDTTLVAQPFDVSRLELTGDAVPLADRIDVGGFTGRAGAFAVSETGVLAYQTNGGQVRSQLVWLDRAGKQLETVGDQGDQTGVELSPDGTRAAVSMLDPARNTRDLWIYEMAHGVRTRFTFDPADDLESIWSPDGSRIVFASRRKGRFDLYQKASNGVGAEDLVLADNLDKYPSSWSADGRVISYYNGAAANPGTARDLWVFPPFGNRKPTVFLRTESSEMSGRFSPDGRWVAYASNESGRFEVYVQPFPGPGGKWQISSGGGSDPRWRRDGKELFYIAPDNELTIATVNGQSGSAFHVDVVQPLFKVRPRAVPYLNHLASEYAVAADGQRFLVNTAVEQTTLAPISIVVNWDAMLKK